MFELLIEITVYSLVNAAIGQSEGKIRLFKTLEKKNVSRKIDA